MSRIISMAAISIAIMMALCIGASAAPAGCTATSMSALDARADKSAARRGETVTITVDSCYEPPDFTLWARFREAPTIAVPFIFDKSRRYWMLFINITQEIQPGNYHVDLFAKDRDGKEVFSYPLENGVPVEVVWPKEQQEILDRWRDEKEKLIKDSTERLDKAYSIMPKFPVVGVWFDALNYHKHLVTNSDSKGPWNPYLRKDFSDEIDYLSKTLGLNMIVLSGGTPEENAYARAAFPNFITSSPQPGDYAIYDEPDFMNRPMEDVAAWAKDMKSKGMKTIINFSGHKADDTWTDYVYKFLDIYQPDVVSVDCYPIFYDFANLEFFRQRVKTVGQAAHEHNAKFFVIVQGFAQMGVWAFPTTFYWQKMIEASQEAGSDGLLFFTWTSGADDRNFMTGIDLMPQEYHRMLHAIVQRQQGGASGQSGKK